MQEALEVRESVVLWKYKASSVKLEQVWAKLRSSNLIAVFNPLYKEIISSNGECLLDPASLSWSINMFPRYSQ